MATYQLYFFFATLIFACAWRIVADLNEWEFLNWMIADEIQNSGMVE